MSLRHSHHPRARSFMLAVALLAIGPAALRAEPVSVQPAASESQPCDLETDSKARGEAPSPDACDTCGVGLFAATVTATAPLTLAAALGLVVAEQTGLIGQDPFEASGIPLWGVGLGCAGAHMFFAAITSVAFGRDLWRLCGSYVDDEEPAAGSCRSGGASGPGRGESDGSGEQTEDGAEAESQPAEVMPF